MALACEVNEAELYEVVEINGKGMGIVATKDIKPSTIIISEKALLRERKINDEIEKYKLLIDEYNLLDNECSKNEIMSLSNCFDSNSNRNELINIYYTNCIKIYNNKKYESALFPNVARINHSCLPNSFWIYEHNIMIVRALFDIKKGEEITASYLPPLQYTLNERQEILSNKYGFKCKCNECIINKRDDIIIKYRELLKNKRIKNIEIAIDILDKQFNGYPILKTNLLNRCADILMDDNEDGNNDNDDDDDDGDYDETLCDKCLQYIEQSIITGLKCYGDKNNNKSDWSETRKRIAILRWYSGDPQQKCTQFMNKWQHLF